MLRGLPNGRLRGNVTAYSNTELRWQFASFSAGANRFDTLLVPFVDLGRVWLWGEEDEAFHLHGVPVPVCAWCTMTYSWCVSMSRTPLRNSPGRRVKPPSTSAVVCSASTRSSIIPSEMG